MRPGTLKGAITGRQAGEDDRRRADDAGLVVGGGQELAGRRRLLVEEVVNEVGRCLGDQREQPGPEEEARGATDTRHQRARRRPGTSAPPFWHAPPAFESGNASREAASDRRWPHHPLRDVRQDQQTRPLVSNPPPCQGRGDVSGVRCPVPPDALELHRCRHRMMSLPLPARANRCPVKGRSTAPGQVEPTVLGCSSVVASVRGVVSERAGTRPRCGAADTRSFRGAPFASPPGSP